MYLYSLDAVIDDLRDKHAAVVASAATASAYKKPQLLAEARGIMTAVLALEAKRDSIYDEVRERELREYEDGYETGRADP